MTYADFTPAMRRYFGSYVAFRNLGFRAEDLYCLVSRSARFGGRLSCFVHLKAQGKEFNLELGPVESEAAAIEGYAAGAKAILAREVPQADLDRMYQESEPYRDKVGFCAALLARGFVLPKSQN